MKVYEAKIRVYTLKDIKLEDSTECIAKFIDSCLSQEEIFKDYHNAKVYKCYTFDNLLPFDKTKVYRKNSIYSFRIRSVDIEFIKFIKLYMENFYNDWMKTLQIKVKVIPQKPIKNIYSINPVLIKNDNGYWKYNMSFEEFEKRITDNLIKKYNHFNNSKISEDFDLYNSIKFINSKPVPIKYKNMTLRGDKLDIELSLEERAQELAYFSLGVGLGENNSRGCGFVNCKFY